MNAAQFKVWRKPARIAVITILVAGLTAGAWAGKEYVSDMGTPTDQFVFYSVTNADLPIVVTERGNLESQVRTEIRCEVENVSGGDRSGSFGSQIIFIVPNGSQVKEGDLLVELDSAAIRDRLDVQVLSVQRATSLRIQAEAKYENQKTQNETAKAEADLKLALAELQLEMYTDPINGEYKLALDAIDRTVDESKNAIFEAKSALALKKTARSGIQTLFELGYRGKSDLDQSVFEYLRAEDALSTAMNKLATNQASRQQMEKYVQKSRQMTLIGEVETAKRNVVQVMRDNESLMAQVSASKSEAISTEMKENERETKLRTQLSKCKIHAPHDGMAVFAREQRGDAQEIAEGTSVRERQQILTLPDLTQMQVRTQVHEAVLDQIQRGLPVTIRVDAFPNRRYVGVVETVAVVPSFTGGPGGFMGTSAKTYDCIVRIPELVENLKPGMTAVVDIHADRIHNVLSVPVQAVFQIDKDHWCYVNAGQSVEKRKIELGRSNDKFVHVTTGLALNDRVVLNPMSHWEAHESSTTEIAPDADTPDVPTLPADVIAKAKSSNSKNSGKGRGERGERGERGKKSRAPRSGKSPPGEQSATGEAG